MTIAKGRWHGGSQVGYAISSVEHCVVVLAGHEGIGIIATTVIITKGARKSTCRNKTA